MDFFRSPCSEEKMMKIVTALIAAMMLLGLASNSLAQSYPNEVFPGLWETSDGVFYGDARFPDTAFVMAQHSNAGQHVCDYGGPFEGNIIDEMEVPFTTKDDGLARVTFCGAMDVDGSPGNIRLAAKMDGGSDCITIRGVNPWYAEGGSTGNSGPVCWEWICKVENEPGKGNKPAKTEHTATVHCASDNYRVKFNDRNMFVDYTYIHTN
jgi:hypothetical protein